MGGPLPLFAYGLLRPGEAGFAELGLEGRVQALGSDRIVGSLYDLGEYPGAVPDNAHIVHGVLVGPCTSDILTKLDAYELYDPADRAGSEYLRAQVTTLGGVTAWVYWYQRDVGGAPCIGNGRWPAALSRRERHGSIS